MLSNETRSSKQNPGTDAAVQQPTANPYPELRGELNLDGDTITERDRRYGVPVPLGAIVLTSECVGRVIGGTDEVAIIEDANGKQHAERWGVVHVQAAGPAFGTGVGAASSAHPFHTLDADAVERVRRDPFREASLHAADLAMMIDRLEIDFDELLGDHGEVIEALHGVILKLGEIADNRASRILKTNALKEGGPA